MPSGEGFPEPGKFFFISFLFLVIINPSSSIRLNRRNAPPSSVPVLFDCPISFPSLSYTYTLSPFLDRVICENGRAAHFSQLPTIQADHIPHTTHYPSNITPHHTCTIAPYIHPLPLIFRIRLEELSLLAIQLNPSASQLYLQPIQFHQPSLQTFVPSL